NSLATTANFISWNNVIAADGLLMPSPVCIMSGSEKLKLISPGGYRLNKRRTSRKAWFHAEQQRLSRKGLPHRDAQAATA
ncbi:MAG: hypothetical protein J5906_08145, partial [Acidaminococcaceae bacterium]|nr:hypothetical protein [Acidaminococcaceae bacterium]